MILYSFICFLTAFLSTLTGIFVFIAQPKNRLHKSWLFFNLAISLWMVSLGFTMLVNDPRLALFFQKMLYLGTIFIPVFFLYFSQILIGKEKEANKLFFLNIFFAFLFIFFLFTPGLFIKRIKPRTYFGYWPIEVGPLYNIFLFWFGWLVLWGLYLLHRGFHNENLPLLQRQQIKLMFWGTFLGFGVGSINFLLDFNINIVPLYNLFVPFYLFFVGYAIATKKLFGMEIILTEGLILLIGILLLIQIFTATSLFWKIINSVIFIMFCFGGWILTNYTFREIKRREEIEKLSQAKTEFLSITSHQLRTPLTAIKGYLSMILEGNYGVLPEKLRKPIENVFLSNERLIRLVNDLLNISRIETGKIEIKLKKVDLEELIESIVQEIEIKAKEKGLFLVFEKPKEKLPQLTLDKDKIRQAIFNLVDNAIKYTQRGGVTIKLEKKNNKALISVIDTGEGMKKEELEKLFISFSRGTAGEKLWTEGAGLGLYIAKKMIELNKGKIWAFSEGKGKGSQFYIELPLSINEKKNINN